MGKFGKSVKIFVYGVLSQTVILLLGIIVPKLLIVNYGSEVNGLLSSVRQVFVYVTLLEAGIGGASVQALYEPISKSDYVRSSQILAATDRYYKRTGFLYAIAVVLLAIIYPIIIKSSISPIVVAWVIFFQGASGVINYFFQGKYTILMKVDGRSYITTNANTVVNVLSKVFQIILIMIGSNIVIIQFSYFIISITQMIYILWYTRRHYPWLDLQQEPDYKSLTQSKNVIIHQIAWMIFNNTDIIVLTYFCGLTSVSIYSLYSMIVSCVTNVLTVLVSSVEFALGQLFNSDRKKFDKLHETYETYFLATLFSLFTITYIMLPSFIRIYTNGIKDANYIDKYLPILFVFLNVLLYSRNSSMLIINIAGHFKQTQNQAIIESIINLSISLILVNIIGIYGVLIGTIIALLYRSNEIIIYANTKILNRKCSITYRRILINFAIMIVCILIIKIILPVINGYFTWGINAIWVSVLCITLFFAVDSLFDNSSFAIIKGVVKGKIIKKKEN